MNTGKKKVKFSLIRFSKKGSYRFTGLGQVDNENLYTKNRIYEDCIRYCHKLLNSTNQFKGNFTQIEQVAFYNDKDQYVNLEIEVSYQLWFKVIG